MEHSEGFLKLVTEAKKRIHEISVEATLERLNAGEGARLIDVREDHEWEEGHIPDSTHLPYHDIDGAPHGIDTTRPVAVICSSGQRSGVAASLLQRHGVERVIHVVDGGVGTWAANGWPIE